MMRRRKKASTSQKRWAVASLVLGIFILWLGSCNAEEEKKSFKQPEKVGGFFTHSCLNPLLACKDIAWLWGTRDPEIAVQPLISRPRFDIHVYLAAL